jgi:Arm DNA-binding domain
MPVKRISKNLIDALRPPATGNAMVWDNKDTGFGVRITAAGHISFVYRYVVSGRERRFTLGEYGEALSVSAARDMVRTRRFVKDGKRLSPIDPLGDVEADRAAKTVNELCDRFLEEHASRLIQSD